MRLRIVLSVLGARSVLQVKSPDGRHTKQSTDKEHALVIEFDCASATDTPGDRNRRITMLIATTNSIPKSVFSCVTRRQGGQDDHVMHSFQNCVDRLGSVKAESKCDQEPKHS